MSELSDFAKLRLLRDLGSVYPVTNWKTPVSVIPAQSIGTFHVVKRTIKKGTTLDMKALGYEKCIFLQNTVATILREGERDAMDTESVWMSDTPQEYFTCWELVARTRGPHVLIGGLGLGLLCHLLALRKDIKHIVVVEIAKPIIDMVKPYLPNSIRIDVVHGDFLKEIHKWTSVEGFQTVIADLWKSTTEDDKLLMEDCRMVMQDEYPNATHLYWGFQNQIDTETTFYALHWLTRKTRKHRLER